MWRLLICVGVVLAVRYMGLSDECLMTQIENQKHKCLSAPRAELEKLRKDLQQKVEAVQSFLQTRILWTNYTHDLPARLPHNISDNPLNQTTVMETLDHQPAKVPQTTRLNPVVSNLRINP